MERNVHTVELVRCAGSGPLGVTISGTEMRGMPITISALTPGISIGLIFNLYKKKFMKKKGAWRRRRGR